MINMRQEIVSGIASIGILASFAMAPIAYGEETTTPPAMLQSHVEVVDENILLRDVFNGVERYGDSAIAKSPAPGKKILLPANWLWRVAKLYRVNWRPTSKLDTSLITRSSTTILPITIEELVRSSLFERTGEDDLIEFDINSIISEMHISPDNDASIRMNRLSYDENSGRFSAEVVAPAQGSVEASATITGNLYRLVEAAVPNKRIMPGDIIRSSDLDWKRFRANRVNNKAVLDASQIVGKSAKRTLVAGKIISLNSVQPPVLVKKKGLVTVTLHTKNMRITTQGKALQNGAMDEIVQIRNLQSDIIIEAIVTGPGQASVINAAELAMN